VNIAVIPARGGSKRIPRKNIKKFLGKPIISYSIEAAINSKCFDKVVVSTDDQEIADIAIKLGAYVPFLRPKDLSEDYSCTVPVVKHTIEWFNDHGQFPTNVCLIYATAPFVKPSMLIESYKLFNKENVDYCFAVTSFPFPIQRAIKITHEGRVEMFQPEHFTTRSQDLEESYHDAGQFTWGKSESFLNNKPSFSKYSIPYILPRYLVQDIDTLEDWHRAELMYKTIED